MSDFQNTATVLSDDQESTEFGSISNYFDTSGITGYSDFRAKHTGQYHLKKSPSKTLDYKKSDRNFPVPTTSKTLTDFKIELEEDSISLKDDGDESTIQRLGKRIDSHMGKSSPAFVNSIGILFLQKVLPVVNDLSGARSESFEFRLRQTKNLIFILNDFTRTLGPFSEASKVFGKVSSIVQNNLTENKPIYTGLSKILARHLPNLYTNHQSILNELQSIGLTSIPAFDANTLFETGEEE